MIRDERQAALDEAIVALQNEAAHAADAADRIDDHRLADLLRDTASRCEAYANALKPDMKALEDLPSEPDQEAEMLEALFSRIHAAFSGDPRATVLQERSQGLEQVLGCLRAAIATQPPQAIADHLHAAEHYVAAARDRLRALAP